MGTASWGTPFERSRRSPESRKNQFHDGGADQIKLFVTGKQRESGTLKFGTETTAERCEMHCAYDLDEIQGWPRKLRIVSERKLPPTATAE
jgi:hypothetical protein